MRSARSADATSLPRHLKREELRPTSAIACDGIPHAGMFSVRSTMPTPPTAQA